MISVRFEHVPEVQARLARVQAIVRLRLEETVRREALNLVAHVKSEKLTDQVLRVRTGRLRRSITARFDGAGTDNFRALVGTNVQYARAHEMGFDGTVPVKQHQRVMTVAFGRIMRVPKTVNVKSHDRKMKLPERSFLRSSLTDLEERITTNIRQAVIGALR